MSDKMSALDKSYQYASIAEGWTRQGHIKHPNGNSNIEQQIAKESFEVSTKLSSIYSQIALVESNG